MTYMPVGPGVLTYIFVDWLYTHVTIKTDYLIKNMYVSFASKQTITKKYSLSRNICQGSKHINRKNKNTLK